MHLDARRWFVEHRNLGDAMPHAQGRSRARRAARPLADDMVGLGRDGSRLLMHCTTQVPVGEAMPPGRWT
jgi:hypothetical protein